MSPMREETRVQSSASIAFDSAAVVTGNCPSRGVGVEASSSLERVMDSAPLGAGTAFLVAILVVTPFGSYTMPAAVGVGNLICDERGDCMVNELIPLKSRI